MVNWCFDIDIIHAPLQGINYNWCANGLSNNSCCGWKSTAKNQPESYRQDIKQKWISHDYFEALIAFSA